jgi:hypothetical protein
VTTPRDSGDEIVRQAVLRDAYSKPLNLESARIVEMATSTPTYRSETLRLVATVVAASIVTVVAVTYWNAASGNQPDRAGSGEPQLDSITIPLYEAERLTPQALLSGILVLEGQCLQIDTYPNHVLTWPSPGTRASSTELTVLGHSVQVGDYVEITGGEYMSPTDPSDWTEPPSRECWRERRILIGSIE